MSTNRDRLAEVLEQHAWRGIVDVRIALDALLPVIDRIANERAAAARREQQVWDRKRVEDYAATIGVELTPGDDMIAAVDEVYRRGAATELRAAGRAIQRIGFGVHDDVAMIPLNRADALDPT